MADPRARKESGRFSEPLGATASDIQSTTASPDETRSSAGDASSLTGMRNDASDQIEVTDAHEDHGNGGTSLEDKRLPLTMTKSHATDVSVKTVPLAKYQPKPWYKTPNPLRWGGIPPIPEERIVSREYNAGLLSLLTFNWMTPLMTTGYKRQLDKQDIWTVNPNRTVEILTAKVRESFKRRHKAGEKNPLAKALHETFFVEFWVGGLCALIGTVMQVTSPFVLRYLIAFATEAYKAHIAHSEPPHIRKGVGLVLGVTFMQLIQSFCMGHFIYRGMTVGGQARAALTSLIYEKSMVISGRAKAGAIKESILPESDESDGKEKTGQSDDGKDKTKSKRAKDKGGKGGSPIQDGLGWGNGRIVNLMSVDASRIDQASALFHMLWTAPIACIITLVLLLINLTYSALAGFGLLVIGVPLLTKAIKSLFVRRKMINKITDQRVSLTQEILQSVRFVKYFGWEEAFIDRLDQIRSREIKSIQIVLAMRNGINAASISMPIFASMLSFITFSLTNHGLVPAEIFSSLALFNGLRIPLNLVPTVLASVIDALSSMQRIENFLSLEEREEEAIHRPEREHAIELRNASFTWERTPSQDPDKNSASLGAAGAMAKSKKNGASEAAKPKNRSPGTPTDDTTSTLVEEREPFKIQELNLQAGRNELIAVIGGVGSGKSSLLAALAGDMRKTDGDVVFGASRAFCPQYAWIQNTSLQNNIVFGKEMDRGLYKKVIQACALQADLDMLPNGDQTEIGERGITISGGQKQRLNIARAIYFDSDIILMDDPLSAVDAHVGRHIFDNAIMGLLKDKCRILATHQLWVLNRCDRIVWMEAGRIQAVGTYDDLMRDHEGFRTLMETTIVKKDDDDEGDEGSYEEEGETKGLTRAETADVRREKKNKKAAALMQQEEKAQSSVPWSVYGAYVRASGSLMNAPLALFLLVLSQGANIATSLWLTYWTSDRYNLSTGQYIGIYAGLGVVQAFLMFTFAVFLTVSGTRASKVMLRRAVTRVLRAPMSFFDTTPLGRITNRFSRDVDVMDNQLSDAMRMFTFTLAMATSVFALIIAYFHWFAVALVPLYLLYATAASYYRASAREVKRFEAVLRSDVFAKFGEGLSGVASIRAYGLQNRFVEELRKAIDEMNSAYYLTFANQRWLSIRIDLIGNLLVFTVGILVVTSRFSVNPSIGGLVLSYILSIVQLLQFSIRQLAEVENAMNSVERLRYYGEELEEEAPLHTVEVRGTWPEKGEIIFDNVEMRYRKGLPLVLQGLSMHIKGGERIGIVGRTGAGKSSIMSTLFRLVELSGGSITVDGINIATIGLFDLRSRLAIIPQDPTLFNGTVRTNLDPFSEHTDLELWSALRQADLVHADANLDDRKPDASRIHLDSVVEEDGMNFSLGQRQLMALARALVRGSQVIVCDEATSSVDMETDDKIQKTMATGFKGKTLLCIAHRLHTIIGYDRICVMDGGRIAQFDTPLALWKQQDGIFRGMCDRSGIRADDIERAREQLDALSASDGTSNS